MGIYVSYPSTTEQERKKLQDRLTALELWRVDFIRRCFRLNYSYFRGEYYELRNDPACQKEDVEFKKASADYQIDKNSLEEKYKKCTEICQAEFLESCKRLSQRR